MGGLLPFLRLLMVPLSISLVGALLASSYLHLGTTDWNDLANTTRMMFVWHASWGLVLTLIVGLPFLRYHVGRQTMGRGTWLINWALVFALPALLQNWLLLPASLLVAWIWWKFYYGREDSAAMP